MRNAIVLTTVLLILVPACVKAVEPIGWWKFEEKDGNTAKDSSGNGFDAAVILGGGAKIWCPGEGFDSNGCAKFTAQQTVVIPNAIWSRVKDKMSIAFWVNQDASAPPDEKWPGPWGIAPTEGVSFPDPNWLKLRAFVPTPNKAIDIGNDSENIYWSPTSRQRFRRKLESLRLRQGRQRVFAPPLSQRRQGRRKIRHYGTHPENQ